LGIIFIPIIVVLILVIILIVVAYNRLVKGRMKVENSWGQINVQLKMRADLVPNLVNTVSGYAKHEKETLTEVMEARNKYMTATNPQEAMNSSGEISALMGRLIAVGEQYPDLKANQNFLNLQYEMNEIEKKISMYRQFYNDTVMMYNRLVVTFPNSITAGMFGFRELPYFQVDEADRTAPQVRF
jgi:LemA protein